MVMFKSIAKRRADDKNTKNVIPFDDEKFVEELRDFVKTTFAELPETEMYEDIEEKEGRYINGL